MYRSVSLAARLPLRRLRVLCGSKIPRRFTRSSVPICDCAPNFCASCNQTDGTPKTPIIPAVCQTCNALLTNNLRPPSSLHYADFPEFYPPCNFSRPRAKKCPVPQSSITTRSHALRGNGHSAAPRHDATQSVAGMRSHADRGNENRTRSVRATLFNSPDRGRLRSRASGRPFPTTQSEPSG
jgi:hypothetical protein